MQYGKRNYIIGSDKIDMRAINGANMNYGRIILHSDLNNFFASVECALNPSLRGRPVAVCGSVEDRHGIVLAKSNLAKKYNIKTAETVYQAKKKCPKLVIVEANYENYIKYSRMARKIYYDYTDKVEPFGADEAWLDITGNPGVKDFEKAKIIADEIRNRIFEELGLTVSVGVSYNKIFAKLASDYKKPDATTVFSPYEYADIIAKLPISAMIYAGKSTCATLSKFGINTIGELAQLNMMSLKTLLGKNGEIIWRNARGEDTSPVVNNGKLEEIKSIGNSVTPPRDLKNNEDVKAMCYMLAESVGTRLRSHGMKCLTVRLSIRESDLKSHEHQQKLDIPTDSTVTIANIAYKIFTEVYDWHIPVRSIGIRGCELCGEKTPIQLSVFDNEIAFRNKNEKIDKTVDNIRKRFGYTSLQRGIVMCDKRLTGANVKDDSVMRCSFAQH